MSDITEKARSLIHWRDGVVAAMDMPEPRRDPFDDGNEPTDKERAVCHAERVYGEALRQWAPDLARFVLLVDEVLRECDSTAQTPADVTCDKMLAVIRCRLGLDGGS